MNRHPGRAFSVSCSVSAGPSQMMAVSFSPSAASTSSKTARAGRKGLAHTDRLGALPGERLPSLMPEWPVGRPLLGAAGNRKSGRKTPPKPVMSKSSIADFRPPGPGDRAGFPCHCTQNPYKPRIRMSRPGTDGLSNLTFFGDVDVARPSRPVPCFRLLSFIVEFVFPKVSKGLPPGTASTLGKGHLLHLYEHVFLRVLQDAEHPTGRRTDHPNCRHRRTRAARW